MIQEALANAGEALRISWSDAGAFDARGLRITNLGDPKLPSDAVNKEYTDGVLNEAKQHADRAENAKVDAESARDTALASAQSALESALRAEFSADEAERILGLMEGMWEGIEQGDFSQFLLKSDLGLTVAKQQDLLNLISEVANKVDKEFGKGLSTRDFTPTLESKLLGIEQGAQKNTVNSVNGKTGHVQITGEDLGIVTPTLPPIATQQQAELGVSNDALMTPLRTAQAIAKLAGESPGELPDDLPKVSIGSYAGGGSGTKDIKIGFRPGYVFILTRYGNADSPTVSYIPGRSALMVIKNGGHRDLDSSYITALADGFRVGGTSSYTALNAKGRVYHYIAIG